MLGVASKLQGLDLVGLLHTGLFQFLDLAAKGGLTNATAPRRPPKMLQLRHGDEIVQIT